MATRFTVVSQRPVTMAGPSGTFEDGMEITFKTAKGIVGRARIPMSTYTVEQVNTTVGDQAELIDNVQDI